MWSPFRALIHPAGLIIFRFLSENKNTLFSSSKKQHYSPSYSIAQKHNSKARWAAAVSYTHTHTPAYTAAEQISLILMTPSAHDNTATTWRTAAGGGAAWTVHRDTNQHFSLDSHVLIYVNWTFISFLLLPVCNWKWAMTFSDGAEWDFFSRLGEMLAKTS